MVPRVLVARCTDLAGWWYQRAVYQHLLRTTAFVVGGRFPANVLYAFAARRPGLTSGVRRPGARRVK
eukprot:3922052-Rhodomonas_salina.1